MSGRRALSLAASATLGAAAAANTASALPQSAIAAAARKHRRLQSPPSTPDTGDGGPLTAAQYADCQADLLQADANTDSQLSQDEFLAFLSYNSGRYGQSWGYASNQQSLGALPLEFPLLFHATACQCAYDSELFEGDMGCCTGENGHIIVYPGVNGDGSEKALSAREEAYTREFCGEAYAAYGATAEKPVTKSPTPGPTVDALEPPSLPPAVGTTTSATTTAAVTTAAATTTRAYNTPAPTPGGTAAPFALTPPTLSAPPTNAPIGGTATPPPSSSPVATGADQLEVGIQYGISSNCGMTAFDVTNGTGGITIKEGLISATEATVVGILNATYPRDGREAEEAEPTNPGGFGGSGGGFRGKSAEAPASMHGVRTRVDGTPHRQLHGEGPRSLHYWHNRKHQGERTDTHRQTQRREKQQRRSLAYYTQSNPAVITDVEDVVDAACPFGINCMRVSSTIFVTLEEGDDPAEVEAVIRDGIQASFADASFFEAIPEGTVFCPPVGTDTTTAATATAGTTTAAATTTEATAPATTTQAATTTTTQTATTPPPVASTTTTTSSTTTTSAASGGETGPIEVSQTYDISNNCGWDAEAVMNPVDGNTLKEGLIEATRTVTIGILNETYPRADDEFVRRRNGRTRNLAYLADPTRQHGERQNERNLAYYTDEYPVTIDRVLDIVTGCDPGKNCLLVVSTITVVTEEGDDPAEVYDAISEGFKESFVDGSFFAAVPEAAASCPTRR